MSYIICCFRRPLKKSKYNYSTTRSFIWQQRPFPTADRGFGLKTLDFIGFSCVGFVWHENPFRAARGDFRLKNLDFTEFSGIGFLWRENPLCAAMRTFGRNWSSADDTVPCLEETYRVDTWGTLEGIHLRRLKRSGRQHQARFRWACVFCWRPARVS